jgi:hypothetical protein
LNRELHELSEKVTQASKEVQYMEVKLKARELQERQMHLMKNDLIRQLEDHRRNKMR